VPLAVRHWSLDTLRDKVQFTNKQRRNKAPGFTNGLMWCDDDANRVELVHNVATAKFSF
jgi:hypothetical protein